jgi:hypothetical protein
MPPDWFDAQPRDHQEALLAYERLRELEGG